MMRTKVGKSLFAIGVVLISHQSIANHGVAATGPEYDYAVVERVEMLTRIVDVPVPREECWEVPVTYYQPPPQPGVHSYTPMIVGGIIGGVVGNQFGSGSGRDWATVTGATLGASVGSDYNNRRAYAPGRSYTSNERRCRIVNDHQQEERADGYLVTYTYNGRHYETRTPNHPGDRIKVRFDVSAVE
jgi:uncharacterized protein YcfJ